MRMLFRKAGMTAVVAVGAGVLLAAPVSASQNTVHAVPGIASSTSSEIGVMAIPPGCSGWIDYKGRGRGHINCKPRQVDVRATVKCTNNKTYSAKGWQYAMAQCPPGYGAIALSGKAS